MTVLVTGGAGYIGSAVVEQLIANGESVVVFDNLSQGHRAAVHPDAVFVKGELANRAEIDAVLTQHRPDAVMHFASRTLVGESMEKPLLYLGDNVTTGLNLLTNPNVCPSMSPSASSREAPTANQNLFSNASCIGSTGYTDCASPACAILMLPERLPHEAKHTIRRCT
jgi:dTDP-D-glucose 4,6-dehydratase